MSPIDQLIIESKKNVILHEIDLLDRLATAGVNAGSDIIQQYALCHSYQNAISAVIDIAQHINAESSTKTPESYSESIRMLGELGKIPSDFALELSEIAKLRNVVVHLYDKLDVDKLANMIPKTQAALRRFLTELNSGVAST